MASCEKIYLTEEEYFEFKKWLPTTSRKLKKQLTSLTHWDVNEEGKIWARIYWTYRKSLGRRLCKCNLPMLRNKAIEKVQ